MIKVRFYNKALLPKVDSSDFSQPLIAALECNCMFRKSCRKLFVSQEGAKQNLP